METIPARRGKATHLKQGQSIRIINTHGEQWWTPGPSPPAC
jgi:uncharacterized protein YcgI (DUF1989 family)